MSCILLVIPLSPAHNDSCVDGVAATPCHACYLPQRKESRHEDPPPHDPFTSTYARRHADPQLLTAYHRWVSALRRPVREALPYLAGSPGPRAHPHLSTPSPPAARLQEHLYPDRLCPAAFVRNHVRASM